MMLHKYLRSDISQTVIYLHTQNCYFYSLWPSHISQNLNHWSYFLSTVKLKKFYFLHVQVPALSLQIPFSSLACSIPTTLIVSLTSFPLANPHSGQSDLCKHCINFECFAQLPVRENTTSGDLSNTTSVFSHMKVCLGASVKGWFSGSVIQLRTLVLYFCLAITHCWLFPLMLGALGLQNGSYTSMQSCLTSKPLCVKAL